MLTINNLHAQTNQIVEIKKVEKTGSAIVIQGIAKVIPANTVIRVSVLRINGKSLNQDKHIIETMDKVIVGSDGGFTAKLKRFGSLDGYNFPTGQYQLEFFAGFNRAWQSVEVSKLAGVKLDELGRSDLGEPHLLPKSSDLVRSAMGVRVLKAIRTVTVSKAETKFASYRTIKIRLEIHDYLAKNNPVRTINGHELLVNDVMKKVGRLTNTQGVSLVCVGDFKNGFGYLANDLFRPGGNLNTDFKINQGTTLTEVCNQQEDDLAEKRRAKGLAPI